MDCQFQQCLLFFFLLSGGTEWLEGVFSFLCVRFCYNPNRFCSGKIVSTDKRPEGGPFKEEQNTLPYFRMVPELWENLSSVFLWGRVWTPRDKTEVCGRPYNWDLVEFLTLRLVHTEPPAIHQWYCTFPYPGTSSAGGFCLWVSSFMLWTLWFSFSASLSL